jgi:hypothetical protein
MAAAAAVEVLGAMAGDGGARTLRDVLTLEQIALCDTFTGGSIRSSSLSVSLRLSLSLSLHTTISEPMHLRVAGLHGASFSDF